MYLYKHAVPTTDNGKPCGTFLSNVTKFNVRKDGSAQWKSRYSGDGWYMERACSSMQPALNVYHNNLFSFYATNSETTESSETGLFDCHGQLLGKLTPGTRPTTVTDAADTIVGFLDPPASVHNYSVVARSMLTGLPVAVLSRDVSGLVWTFEILDPTDPATDPGVLSVVAGLVSFSEEWNDGCNTYFFAVAWAILASSIFLLVGGCCFGYRKYY